MSDWSGLFLPIPDYVRKGIELADLVDIDPGDTGDVERLIVEAYLLSTGSWLARLDPHTELDALASVLTIGTYIGSTPVPPVLTDEQWTWIVAQLPTIGG